MNADQIELLGTLRGRIRKIMDQLTKEKDKNSKLEKEYESLKSRFDQQKAELTDIEQKYNNLKLAKVLSDENEEGKEARIKVNRIVREIDKCIALLNR